MYNIIKNIEQEEFWQEWTLAHWKVQIVLRKIKDDLYNLKRYTLLMGQKINNIKVSCIEQLKLDIQWYLDLFRLP